ncbi:unnamed protein product [Brassica rapa subsp. narinosa]|uniref:(rape) hypothetical protein n=1 Tax=Brassica napus TaxID=3708 RepID=A0A816XBP0_BRANA|nr:unnamed protein product [Brassica napus]
MGCHKQCTFIHLYNFLWNTHDFQAQKNERDMESIWNSVIMTMIPLVMVLRLLTVTMVASMYLELVKEDNYLLKTFKLMLSNYVYTNIYS